MTFQESEYPDLIETVLALAKKGVFGADDLLPVMWQLHRQVPIYPGIVKMCLEKIKENPCLSECQTNDLVAIEKDGEKIVGYVEKISGNRLVLRDGYVKQSFNRKEIVIESDNQLERLQPDILKRSWPTLVFEEKK